MSEQQHQEELHGAIVRALQDRGDLADDQILTGWVLIFEATSLGDSRSSAGHFYGPREMTTWKSLGLVEWVRRFCLIADDDD